MRTLAGAREPGPGQTQSHDGTKGDTAALKFSIDRLMNPATKPGMRSFYSSVHDIEVLDPLHVQIRLKQPYAFMLHMLAAYRTGLVLYSPTAIQKYSIEDRKQGQPEAVVGCDPFKLVEWVKGRHVVMDRFDKYFQPGLPYVNRATGQVEPGDIPHPEIDDALDGLAEVVLRTKGEVVVVPGERMPSATGLAAAYRF